MIYVDKAQQWPGALAARLGPSCHLVTDGPPEELAAFAKVIGLRASWLQHAGTRREHYDVFGARRARAAKAGAVEIDRKRFVQILRAKKVVNVCEHGDHPAPEGKRFCSIECEECESTPCDETEMCANLCKEGQLDGEH